jgi:hypothetical protein
MPSFNEQVTVTMDATTPAVNVDNVNHTPQAGPGVMGKSDAVGVWGESRTWNGTAGISHSTTGGAGVYGEGVAGGPGVMGISSKWIGVYGETRGSENGPAGVWGEGKEGGSGVKGHASGPGAAGVAGFHLTNRGPGIFGKGAPAGRFEGDVEVTGDIRLANADCAEDFDVISAPEVCAGSVLVLGTAGVLEPCTSAYDRRVVGVVSGAGSYRPAVILDRLAAEPSGSRKPIALVGKVFCAVDAAYGPVAVGDLLTTSPTPGHAMRALDPGRAFGAVLGKALADAPTGTALIPILVTLQ